MSSLVRLLLLTALAASLAPGIASAQAGRGAPVASQSAGPWFGTALPAPVSDPAKPVMKYDDAFRPIAAKFPHAAGQHDELLDGAELKAAMKTIVGFSLESYAAGDKVWGRRAATPAFFHAIEWAVEQFKSAGIADAKIERFPVTVPMWTPRSWRVQLNGDDAFGGSSPNVILTSAFPQPGGASIAGGSITAPVVFAGHGTDADLAGRDVKGKIAVIHVRPEPSLFGSAEQRAAERVVARGAIAVIQAV